MKKLTATEKKAAADMKEVKALIAGLRKMAAKHGGMARVATYAVLVNREDAEKATR